MIRVNDFFRRRHLFRLNYCLTRTCQCRAKMKKFCLIFFLVSVIHNGSQAQKLRALFLGNSYTEAHNLPNMIRQIALSAGDTLEFEKNTPGGYTLKGHSTNPTSLNLIRKGNWDYVVLQEQSQLPSFPDSQVAVLVYPYARLLDSLIKAHNPCATTLFFMTWGRKNGDAENCPIFPPVCTYEGMDSLLDLRYRIMTQDNAAALSPVGRVWRFLRTQHPTMELYESDGSHPATTGSFAAACTFYSLMFKKNPELLSSIFTLEPETAAIIKSAARTVAFDSLSQWTAHLAVTKAGFDYILEGNDVAFTNLSNKAQQFFWDFGDGTTSTTKEPTHFYNISGTYEVKLTATDTLCLQTDSTTRTLVILPTGLDSSIAGDLEISVSPNPAFHQIWLNLSTGISNIEIVGMGGKCFMNFEIEQPAQQSIVLDIHNIPQGLYLLKAQNKSNKQIMRRLLKL